MRYVVEIECHEGRVEGFVLVEDRGARSPFSGWLELLSRLEPGAGPPAGEGTDQRGPG